VANFLDLVEAATHYPCVKRAWVEYLGEHVDPRRSRADGGCGRALRRTSRCPRCETSVVASAFVHMHLSSELGSGA